MPDVILDIYPSPSPFLNLPSANIYGFWTTAHNNLLLAFNPEIAFNAVPQRYF
jgi:hypothetical protein